MTDEGEAETIAEGLLFSPSPVSCADILPRWGKNRIVRRIRAFVRIRRTIFVYRPVCRRAGTSRRPYAESSGLAVGAGVLDGPHSAVILSEPAGRVEGSRPRRMVGHGIATSCPLARPGGGRGELALAPERGIIGGKAPPSQSLRDSSPRRGESQERAAPITADCGSAPGNQACAGAFGWEMRPILSFRLAPLQDNRAGFGELGNSS